MLGDAGRPGSDRSTLILVILLNELYIILLLVKIAKKTQIC